MTEPGGRDVAVDAGSGRSRLSRRNVHVPPTRPSPVNRALLGSVIAFLAATVVAGVAGRNGPLALVVGTLTGAGVGLTTWFVARSRQPSLTAPFAHG